MKTGYVGIDVSQASFTAAFWLDDQPVDLGDFDNQQTGFETLATAIATHEAIAACENIHIILEATGGYELRLLSFINSKTWLFSLPNPLRVREWAKGMGYRVKTDRVDGRILAHFGHLCRPDPQQPVPEAVEQLDSLLQRQEDVQKLYRQESNRQHALSYRPHASPAAAVSLERTLAFLEKELQTIEEEIADLLKANPQLRAQSKQLLTVSGVGKKTVLSLLVLCHRFHARTSGQGTSKGVTAYTGLDARPFDSGSSVHRRPTISKMGNSQIRAKLFLAALGGIRGKGSPLRHFYLRLVDRGKPKKLALVAASRKIIVWSWAVFRNDVPFDASRFSSTPS